MATTLQQLRQWLETAIDLWPLEVEYEGREPREAILHSPAFAEGDDARAKIVETDADELVTALIERGMGEGEAISTAENLVDAVTGLIIHLPDIAAHLAPEVVTVTPSDTTTLGEGLSLASEHPVIIEHNGAKYAITPLS